ncbi:hypothetical protein [Sulfuricurvum sp.]|uniref:hypothetical protein n=1 Tax=Sulfuricurvum sp. TaxID=2025608 RepID=UPI00262221EB|nr:hypothetical protein [Sulfuricurvum sp.]MDD2780468.1 hypothetical protein [Sulfuricurvum sp.]
MKEIGGYFELELKKKKEYHHDALKLNSGRNCLKYILSTVPPHKVYVPCYICDSLLEPLVELGIKYEFYNIDAHFEILEEIDMKSNDRILYVNYFGMKSCYIDDLSKKYGTKLIVDNTQAFFENPILGIDTIYSPRKFFGVSDGGYLYTRNFHPLYGKLEVDYSVEYAEQLLGRIDKNASFYYTNYQKSENRLSHQPIALMSKLTQRILNSIDYHEIQKIRNSNFSYLHEHLVSLNLYQVEPALIKVPMIYPFLTANNALREKLIEAKIYVARYWNEVLQREVVTEIEKNFVDILPLPIDQRYGRREMKKIVAIIKESVYE